MAVLAAGVTFLLVLWLLKRRRRLRVGEQIGGITFAATLILLALWPHALDSLLALFSFERGGGGRLLGISLFAVAALFLLLFAQMMRIDRLEESIDGLVRQLAKREFRRTHEPGDAPVHVIVPAYNEADNIAAVLERIPASVLGLRTHVLVVIDGATDRTEPIVRDLKKAAVSYVVNRGGGSAFKAGYEVAVEDGAEIIVTLDADGQHLPEEIPLLVRPVLAGDADLVNGSRVLGSYEADSRLREKGIILFNWLCSLLLMRRITDCSSGYRAIRAEALQRLELRQVQFHASEMLIEAVKKGLRVVEVPITIRRRQSGVSKKGPNVRYAIGFARALIGTWLR